MFFIVLGWRSVAAADACKHIITTIVVIEHLDHRTKAPAHSHPCRSELAGIAEAKGPSIADLETAASAQLPNECAAYIYTSGTTGSPKAVMISHDNIVFESRSVITALGIIGNTPEEERIISYLPLSHVAGMMVDIVLPLVVSAEMPGWVCVFFARNYDLRISSIVERFTVVKPTLFLGVPRVWEKIQAKMIATKAAAIAAGELSATALRVSDWGKEMSLAHAADRQMGGSGKKPFLCAFPVATLLTPTP